MKKCILCALSFLLLIGCSQKNVKKEDIHGIVEIQYNELIEKLDQDIQFILYIGRPDCGDCVEFKPILEDYLNDHSDQGVYYLNIKAYRDAALSENASDKEKDFYDHLYERFKIDWTPTLEVISLGEVKETYKYLDEEYYKIKNQQEQIKKKEDFIQKFKEFMDKY